LTLLLWNNNIYRKNYNVIFNGNKKKLYYFK